MAEQAPMNALERMLWCIFAFLVTAYATSETWHTMHGAPAVATVMGKYISTSKQTQHYNLALAYVTYNVDTLRTELETSAAAYRQARVGDTLQVRYNVQDVHNFIRASEAWSPAALKLLLGLAGAGLLGLAGAIGYYGWRAYQQELL